MANTETDRFKYAARLILAAEDIDVTIELHMDGLGTYHARAIGRQCDIDVYIREFSFYRNEVIWLINRSRAQAEAAIAKARSTLGARP